MGQHVHLIKMFFKQNDLYFIHGVFQFFFFRELIDVENFVDKHGFETLCARDKHGYTPAHWVALDGNVEMMRYLVERNAPIDLRCLGTQGPRPIHWACRKGHASNYIFKFKKNLRDLLAPTIIYDIFC